MNKPTMDSFVRNCRLIPRDVDECLIEAHLDEDGNYVARARLDGYTIIPNEQYEALKAAGADMVKRVRESWKFLSRCETMEEVRAFAYSAMKEYASTANPEAK